MPQSIHVMWNPEVFETYLKQEPNVLPILKEIFPDKNFEKYSYDLSDETETSKLWAEDEDSKRTEIIL